VPKYLRIFLFLFFNALHSVRLNYCCLDLDILVDFDFLLQTRSCNYRILFYACNTDPFLDFIPFTKCSVLHDLAVRSHDDD